MGFARENGVWGRSYTARMFVADAAAVVATLLAWTTLVPQITKLWRTRNADGVSATWAMAGAVSNAAWTAYLLSQRLWLAVPSTAVSVLFYLLVGWLIARTGRALGVPTLLGSAWATLLVIVGLAGGWSGLGLLLGVSFGVQAIPSVWTAFRTWAPQGISPGTWQLALAEGSLWLVYGAAYRDRPIVIYGVLSCLTSLLMLSRYYGTRRRWLDRGRRTSLRSTV